MIQNFDPLPTFIHFPVPSKLKKFAHNKIFFHIIKYFIDVVRYIYVEKKHLKKVFLSSLVHHACPYAHEFITLLLAL
jgi:hypothetical protein